MSLLHQNWEWSKSFPNQTWQSSESISGMLRAVQEPKISSIDASMSESRLQQLEELMLTQESPNAKIAGDGDIQRSLVGSKDQSVSSVMVPTNRRTTMNSVGVAKPTKRQTCFALKLKRANLTRIPSNAPIAKETIKQTQIHVCFGRTALIESGTWRNILRSMKTESSQFVWLQMGNPNHDI